MSVSPQPSSGVSHLSVFVLTLITVLCVVMIGAAGLAKFQLDRSEIALAAPDVSFTPEQENYEKTLRALGHGGFMEAAYRLINKRDKAALGDMKMHLKTAQDVIARINDKTPPGLRHDLKGIVEMYAAIYAKAEQSLEANGAEFSPTDLSPALATLPLLDTRLQAAVAQNRMKAQDSYRFWGLSLTLIAWISLLLAAAMAAGIYLVYRNRQAAPLRALAQSIQNLARGDMQKPIWGMHRPDAIGDLARAIDLARYHFSQLPDLSLMSEQGPVRLKFEGETRSVFEAMMRNIADEFVKARQESSGYANNLGNLQQALSGLCVNLNSVIDQLQAHDTESYQTLQQLVGRINETSQQFSQVQQTAVTHINKLVPYMQDRATKMAEVTSIAGSQVTQSLQKLMQVEQDMRANAEQSQQVVDKFASNTNDLSERLFASANLMQASSKMLSETTDTVQSRFNEAVETLSRGENHLKDIMRQVDDRLNQTAKAEESMALFAERAETNLGRVEGSINNMTERHDQLSEQVIMATQRMEGVVSSFETAQRSMSEAMTYVKRDGEMLSSLLQELRNNNEHLLSGITKNSQAGYAEVQGLAERSQRILAALENQIADRSRSADATINEMTSHTRQLNDHALTATAELVQTITALRSEHERLSSTRSSFSDSVTQLGNQLAQQTNTTLNKTEEWANQNFNKLSGMTDEMEAIMQRLSILGQLTGTLGNVAGQLGQIVPALANGGSAPANPTAPIISDSVLESIVEELNNQLKGQWNEAMAHMESMHDQLAKIIEQQKDQLETRLVVMDKKLRAAAEQPGSVDPRQMDMMNEILIMLSKISEHITILDEAVQGRTQRHA